MNLGSKLYHNHYGIIIRRQVNSISVIFVTIGVFRLLMSSSFIQCIEQFIQESVKLR